jgi:hypothetical protein
MRSKSPCCNGCSKAEILDIICAAVLPTDNVIDLVREHGRMLRETTVLAGDWRSAAAVTPLILVC